MSEPRKNHLDIDGGQVKEDDHVSSYKPIPESDTDFRPSKLSKSKEKLSDEAEERLLHKEREARVTRVDMADAKYVVGDHRNGDAKIELDANKRQFSGLTKEELLKYADDPFWVRLRWCMFVLFWALWLCMLAGAIAIIIQAPKCAPPAEKTWYEVGPLADMSSSPVDYPELDDKLPLLAAAKVQAVFISPCEDSYEVLEDSTAADSCLSKFKEFVERAKDNSVKVIVDLTANFVSTGHAWFQQSENRSAEYADYFTWAVGKDFDTETNRPNLPNNWLSTSSVDTRQSAWTWSEQRKEYYLHQYGEDQPDLNFHNPAVVARFDAVLGQWMQAGAAGVRLLRARELVVNRLLPDEELNSAAAAVHSEYASLRHKQTSDRPELDGLLAHWAHIVAANATESTVFTIAEDGHLPVEWHRLERNSSALRPRSVAPVSVRANVTAVADEIIKKLAGWPALQLSSGAGGDVELATLAMLLPAAPVLAADQIEREANDTATSDMFVHLVELRGDASIQHGQYAVAAVPAQEPGQQLLACARWKSGHTGYAAVYNPSDSAARANLTALQSLPAALSVHHMSRAVRAYTNYTINLSVQSDDVLVPPKSSLVLSYVPVNTAEQ